MDRRKRFILACIYLMPFILGLAIGYTEIQKIPEPARAIYSYQQMPQHIQRGITERETTPPESPSRIKTITRAWLYNINLYVALCGRSPLIIPDMQWFYEQGRLTGLWLQETTNGTIIAKMILLGASEIAVYLLGIVSTVSLFYNIIIERIIYGKRDIPQRTLFIKWGTQILTGIIILGFLAVVENFI